MEPAEPSQTRRRVEFSGTLHVSCGDVSFALQVGPGVPVVDFPSLGTLMRARGELAGLNAAIQRLPPLPAIRLERPSGDWEIQIHVRARPVGKVVSRGGTTQFSPTPLAFLKRFF